MKLALLSFAGAVLLASITVEATTTYNHALLRGGNDDDIEEDKTHQSLRILFPFGNKVKMCKIDQLNPARFHTEIVKKRRVQRLVQKGYKEGRCARHCDTLCTTEEECILANGQGKCVPQCTPPNPCLAGQECKCSCVATPRTRFLTFAATNQMVPMCLIEQTSPTTKFRTIIVKKSEVQANLEKGVKKGSCDKHCSTLCPGMTCSLASGECAPLPAVTIQCTGVTSCSAEAKKCDCTCVNKVPTDPCANVMCNDNNRCTVDTCDPTTGRCKFKRVDCYDGEKACDPYDGKCYALDTVAPCVAVIDEWDKYDKADMDSLWKAFRDAHPTRPFCLLVPEKAYNEIPTYFDADNLNGSTVDRTIKSFVKQDHGDVNKVSDWFKICQLGNYSASDVDHVDFFVDITESMPSNHIPESLAKFKSDCSNIGLEVKAVYENADNEENWIAPFLPKKV